MRNIKNKIAGIVGVGASSLLASNSYANEYNLPEPADPIVQEIFDLHMMTSMIALVIMIVVTAIVVYSLVVHRKDKGYVADQTFHTSWFGRWAWLLVPVFVLGLDFAIAHSAQNTLDKIFDEHAESDMTVKIIGSQWKWSYEYLDTGVKLTSNLNKSLTPKDEFYLRDVDTPLVLPVNTKVRLLHTTTDVIHNWWVPAIAYKVDAVPGYITETRTEIIKEGTYRGQCAENCGTGHAFMPIVVEAVSKEKFAKWQEEQVAAAAAAAAEASSDKKWPMAEMMAKGEELYKKNCAACHQVSGEGVPGVFKALKGSAKATGDPKVHIQTVMNGVAGSAMAAWKDQLNDLEVAAIITYERNAWGNDAGDVVQPKDVAAER